MGSSSTLMEGLPGKVGELFEKETIMNLSRRNFFVSAVGLVTFGLLGSIANAEQRRRARPGAGGETGPLAAPLVDPKTDPTAQAMHYSENHATVKKDLQIAKQGVPFKDQHCKNCGFYKEVGQKDGKTVGTCTIFAGKLVESNSWCTSWNKKA